MSGQLVLELPAPPSSEAVVINSRCTLQMEGDQRVVVVAGLPVHHYSRDDPVAEAYAMVFLADSGFAQQNEVARAFSGSTRTVRRHQRRYGEGGMAALATRSGWRPGRRRIAVKRLRLIQRLKADGLNNCEIARRLGVTEKAIRKLVVPAALPSQGVLPLSVGEAAPVAAVPAPTTDGVPAAATRLEGEATPGRQSTADTPAPTSGRGEVSTNEKDDEDSAPLSLDSNPSNRVFDRLLACMGLLDDAAPVFGEASAVAGAGVMLAIPLLVESGIFRIARKVYGDIGPAFYGLRTTLLTLLLMALSRIKRPESLKEHDPATLGRILGLDRAPEVKTVRRKLTRLASYHQAECLGAELARLRVAQRGRIMGFLYVDGHVRVYHGQRTIPKTHVARMRLSMPATTDYWVNDQRGDPLFVMTAPANAGMVKMLPEILGQVRRLVGDRPVTIVFDRGGWSPKLFQKLIKDGFDILTYRKGKSPGINEKRFLRRRAKLDGRWVSYRLHDQNVRFLNGKLRLRQVTRLSDNGHQTQVLTSRWDLRDIEVAYRMFERWRQENFFKYMREEFLIDALSDYHLEPDDPTRTVPNPQRRVLDKKIRSARAELAKLEQAYGAAAIDNPEQRHPTMRGFKIVHGKLGNKLRAARRRLAELLARRRALPRRVEVRDTSSDAIIKLATERKHLTNIIKMVAYQAESDLLALLHPHYARADQEGRTLLHELFGASADIQVIDEELRVTLAPLSSPHRTLAVEALCELLNDTATTFPGSKLRLRFAVHPPPRIGLAFPGPAASRQFDTSLQGP
jgi:DNA-binding CsgD family transcriptional regulator